MNYGYDFDIVNVYLVMLRVHFQAMNYGYDVEIVNGL